MAISAESMPFSADDALAMLKDGNRRFLQGQTRSITFRRESMALLAKSQQPYATILGCSDSRVPPELLFDVGLGELFVVRVAGNSFSNEVAGSLQYAGSHLHTPLMVILGHEGCGAVKAALAVKHEGEQALSRIHLLLQNILPGVPDYDERLSDDERLSSAVEANVRWTVRQILETPEGRMRLEDGKMKVVGAIYEIETGHVRFLAPKAN